MNKVQIKLTVLFDGDFWIGIFERIVDNKLYVAKYTFSAEPKDVEIYNFILNNYDKLRFSPSVEYNVKTEKKINPKRLQRLVKKQITSSVGTKSQQALKLQQEENKTLRKNYNKEKKEKINELKFKLKQQKRLEKHKGK